MIRRLALFLLLLAAVAAPLVAQQGKPGPKPKPKTAAAKQPPKPLDPNTGKLPPIPRVTGPIRLDVVYPARTDVVDAGANSFLLGSTGTGDARLTINGDTVHVWPNGAFVAWLPFPNDSVIDFKLVAFRPGGERDSLVYRVRRAVRAAPPTTALWIDTLSMRPKGRVWWPENEYLPLSVRAAEGSEVRLHLPRRDLGRRSWPRWGTTRCRGASAPSTATPPTSIVR